MRQRCDLKKDALRYFKGRIVDAKTLSEVKKAVLNGKVARTNFCSIELKGEKCAEVIEKQLGAKVRGIRVDKKEAAFGKCIVCKKNAESVVYIGREY